MGRPSGLGMDTGEEPQILHTPKFTEPLRSESAQELWSRAPEVYHPWIRWYCSLPRWLTDLNSNNDFSILLPEHLNIRKAYKLKVIKVKTAAPVLTLCFMKSKAKER